VDGAKDLSPALLASGDDWPFGGDPDRLLRAVRDRIHRYAEGRTELVDSPEALKEAGALLALQPDRQDVCRVTGVLFWCRFEGQDEQHRRDDLAVSLALLRPIWERRRDDVPPDVAELLAEIEPGVVRPWDAWSAPASSLIDLARSADDATAASLAVELLRHVVTRIPPDDDEFAAHLANLARSQQILYELTGLREPLQEAVTAGRRACAAFHPADPRLRVTEASLAVALRRWSAIAGNLADLDAAIDIGRTVANARPVEDPAAAERLSNLGVALQHRGEWTHDTDDLNEAVEVQERALDMTAAGDPRRPARLVNLAAALHARSTTTDSGPDLEQAIHWIRAAEHAASEHVVTRALVQASLCDLLRGRFQRDRHADDLDASVQAGRLAVALFPPTHSDRAGALVSLSNSLRARFERTGTQSDLDEAVETLRHVVATTGANHPEAARRSASLGQALTTRAERGSHAEPALATADLDEAVDAGRRAIEAVERGRGQTMPAAALSNALLARFERSHRVEDLHEAIEVSGAALSSDPPDQTSRGICLANHAVARYLRHELNGNRGDLEAAVELSRHAALMPSGLTTVRVRAAVRWGTWAGETGDRKEALDGFDRAVSLLADVAPHDLETIDQEFELSQLGSIGSDAAACALNCGQVEHAVRLLEHGRGILLGHALTPMAPPGGDTSFLDDPPAMERLVEPGPIVMVNVSRFRSDAVILTRDGIRVLPLPHMTAASLREVTGSFLTASAVRRRPEASAAQVAATDDTLREVLDWLWTTVVGPVAAELAVAGIPEPGRPWPRVWWCPTGLLSLLPLSAAGRPARDGAPGTSVLVRLSRR
jgi:tetratricopeptide (TPR) repeat protein